MKCLRQCLIALLAVLLGLLASCAPRTAAPSTPAEAAPPAPVAVETAPQPPEPETTEAPEFTPSATAPEGSNLPALPRPELSPPSSLVPVIPGREPAIPRTWFEEGVASWYGPNFVGRPTANGEIFDPSELTAAHKFLPFDTRVLVTHLDTGRSVVVRINDRGPFVGDRIIDLSRAAAETIDMIGSGTARVRLQVAPLASGEHPLLAYDQLQGYDAIVPGMREGDLVVATGRDNRRTVLRSVATAPPTAPGLDGQEVWVAPALAERFGTTVYIDVEGIPLGGEQANSGR